MGRVGEETEASKELKDNTDKYGISQRTFFPTGSKKVTGKQFSAITDEVNIKMAEKMKKYGVNEGMRRYIKIMKNATDHAIDAPVVLDDGTTAYTDSQGRIVYIDGDAINEIYENEKREEDAIDEMTRKALLSDTVANILLGENYVYLAKNSSSATLKKIIHSPDVLNAEARPEMLRCMAPKSMEYSLGITKLRAIIKMCRPVLEYKSSKADDNIYVTDAPKFDTGMVATR